jgi:hypothetical protein
MSRTSALEKRIETASDNSLRKTIVFYHGRNMRLITIGGLALELSARLAMAGARKITLAGSEAGGYLLLDREEMEELLRAIADGTVLGHRPDAVIGGSWLFIATVGRQKKTGCALLTVILSGNRSGPRIGLPESMNRLNKGPDVTQLESAVKKHRGAVRCIEKQGTTILSIYLPLLKRN